MGAVFLTRIYICKLLYPQYLHLWNISEGFEMDDAAHIKNSERYADKNIATGVFMLHK